MVLLPFLYLVGVTFGELVALTDTTFEETINSGKPVFVKFYAPWCGHCKKLAPDYIKLAEEIKNGDDNYIIAELDATIHKETANKYNITGYPTILLFANGAVIEYEGNRQVEDMLNFIKENTKSSLQLLNSIEEIKNVAEGKGNRCILISDNKDDKRMFSDVAKSIGEDKYNFTYTTEKLGKEYFTEIIVPSVVILRDFEEKKIIYTEPLKLEELKEFLVSHSREYVKTFDFVTSIEILYKRQHKLILLITSKKEDRELNEIFRNFAISKQSPEFIFGKIVKKNEDWSKKLIKYFRIKEDLPRIEIVDTTTINDPAKDRPKRYVFEGKIQLNELETFLDKYKDGKLTPFKEPEPEPEPEYVKEVTAATFNTEVIKNDNDVLILFYSEDCGHCKLFAPVYKALAEAMKDNKKLSIVEINGVKNKIPGMYVSSFPSIYLYPGNQKKYPIQFINEKRTKKTLIEFLKENCVHSVHEMKEDL